MLEGAKKFVIRKFRKISYDNTQLPEGYEAATEDYRRVRDDIEMLAVVIKDFASYEHGGHIMKKVTNLTNTISSSTKIKSLRREDIYMNAAALSGHLGQSAVSQPLSRVSESFSQSFCRMSEAKNRMNERLGSILVSLGTLRKDGKRIDDERQRVDSLRTKLEEMIQSGNYAESEKNKLLAEFNFAAGETLVKMREFVGDSGVVSILTQVTAVYREFLTASLDELSKVN